MTPDEEHSEAHSTNEHSFDELAKGLARENLTRRDALKWVGAAVVGGLLSAIPGVALAKPPPHGIPPGQGGTIPGKEGGTPPGQGTTTTTTTEAPTTTSTTTTLAPTTTTSTTTTPPPARCGPNSCNPGEVCCEVPTAGGTITPTCAPQGSTCCRSEICSPGQVCCPFFPVCAANLADCCNRVFCPPGRHCCPGGLCLDTAVSCPPS